jgi:anti-sigma factor RsiW
MNSRRDGDDRVRRLLGLLDPATQSESSDHVDDDTLTLLIGGMASARELAAVRAHLVVCPACRRLVGRILR